jgi:hypothetical protein
MDDLDLKVTRITEDKSGDSHFVTIRFDSDDGTNLTVRTSDPAVLKLLAHWGSLFRLHFTRLGT